MFLAVFFRAQHLPLSILEYRALPHLANMASISKLPSEILFEILEYVHISGLANLMLCCRALHRVASTVLYRHIELQIKLRDESPTSRFIKQLSSSSIDLIQSLSLQFSQIHLMALTIESPEPLMRLYEVEGLLPRLKSLQTFSLSVEEPSGQAYPIPTFAITRMLRILPKTVVNLNLDFDNLHNYMLTQPHLCEAISDVIPRLICLRLRLSHFCDRLFRSINQQVENPLPTTLEYIVIRLDLPSHSPHGNNTCRCWGERQLRTAGLANGIRKLYEHGKLPKLRALTLIDRVDAVEDPRHDEWNVFKVRELTKTSMSITTFPWCARGGSSSLFMIRDAEGDWFGSYDEISESLERRRVSFDRGCRLQRKQKVINRPGSLILDHTGLSSRQTVIEKFGVSFRIWKHEELTGMKLLHARSVPGFDDMEVASEVLPLDWTWVREGPWGWTITPIGGP